MSRKWTRLALAAAAPLILIGALTLTSGVASAKTKGLTGSITCTSLTTTINWNPGLVPGKASSKTTQITFTDPMVSGCTTSAPSDITGAASVTATASLTKHGNSCSSLLPGAKGPPTTYTFNITWNGTGGYTSKVVFKGSTTQTSPPAFTLNKGKMTGSFASKTASASATPDADGATDVTDCVEGTGPGVGSVIVIGGSFSSLPLT